MPDNKAKFTAVISFEPSQEHEIKFRASIIEQHKEIESQIIFANYS
jgi:alpha-acetolactate decarboxylase